MVYDEHWLHIKDINSVARLDPGLSQPGDEMEKEDQMTYTGDNGGYGDALSVANSTIFKGLIDWVRWKPEAAYSGDDSPRY